MLSGKRVLLGVTGGIAAYKAAELTRSLIKKEASVTVIMTKNATEFISPLTFQTLSGNPTYVDTFAASRYYDIAHISLTEKTDLMIVAPATANCLAKMALGIADDLLGTTVLALKAPLLLCPAMNVNMWLNPAVQENLDKLKKRGVFVLEPAHGELACKAEGYGRLPEIEEIIEEAESILTEKDLSSEHILVTAGPTREPIDPVRFITNYSSGKMGYALAIMARRRGAKVTLVSGPTNLKIPRGVDFVRVTTAREMYEAVLEHFNAATVVIKAAAVADYRPREVSPEKIKKRTGTLSLLLTKNPDIIKELGKRKGNRLLIGFAMETENLIENAYAKLKRKNLDFIVANALTDEGAGFEKDTNIVTIISKSGEVEKLPQMEKIEVAKCILDKVVRYRGK